MILPDDVAFLPVAELSQQVRAKKLSPVDLAETALARAEKLDPKLRCFVTRTPELALEQARAAKKEIDAGKWRGPLHGIPYGLKDLIDTRGIKTTWGAKPYANRVPSSDATVYERLRAAGAVLVGKLAMIELAGGLGYEYPDSSLTGACATPWDLARWSGGSSSGSGSAVAAGIVPFAIGSETWGSITCPSSFCGVTGLRPTYGVVSRKGAMALSWTLDKVGPMARDARDCETVLGALAGRDPLDPTSIDAPARDTKPVKDLKAALVMPDWKMDAEQTRATENAIDTIRSLGVQVEKAALPDFPWEPLAVLFVVAEVRASFEELLSSGRVMELASASRPGFDPNGGAIGKATATDYVKAMRIRAEGQAAMSAFFGKYDLVVSPTLPFPAPKIDESFKTLFETVPDPVGAMGNVCGLPALALPCGFTRKLPVSIQLVGRALDEHRLTALGAAFQGKTSFQKERPPV